MFSKYNLSELIHDGYSEIKISQNNICSIIFHFIVPISISLIFIFFNITIDDVFVSNVISSISIFSGLLFSVIFILLENYNKRKDKIGNNPPEELVRYVNRYKDFTSKISTIILFSIVVAMISIIILLLIIFILKIKLSNINYEFIFSYKNQLIQLKKILLCILQTICITLLYNYFLIVINLIKEIYAMVFDSINRDL